MARSNVYIEALPSGTVTVTLVLLPDGAAQLDYSDFVGLQRRYIRRGRNDWLIERHNMREPVRAELVPDQVRQAWVKMAHITASKMGA